MYYFLIIVSFGLLPSAAFIFLARHKINWRALLFLEIIVLIVASISDYVGIQKGVWTYTVGSGKTIGISFFSIPLEDYIFFLAIPPWIIGCYELLRRQKDPI